MSAVISKATLAAQAKHFPKDWRHLGPLNPYILKRRNETNYDWRGKPKPDWKRIDNAELNGRVRSYQPKIKPSHRIKRWNIQPGDKVRLLTGESKHIYADPGKGVEGGFKTYTVRQVDWLRNRVKLEGLVLKKSSGPPPEPAKPDDYDSWEDERKQQWAGLYRQRPPPLKAIHYSNVRLMLRQGTSPLENTFAKRISTGGVRRQTSRDGSTYRWDRFAAGVPPVTSGDAELQKGLAIIPWPEVDAKKQKGTAGEWDTDTKDAIRQSLVLPTPEVVATTRADETLPETLRSPMTTFQLFSDEYIINPANRAADTGALDSVMPIYLSEELAPRFARHKIDATWRAARHYEALERKEIAEDAVRSWVDGGKDEGLRKAMDSAIAGLKGVSIRPRTRAEVAESAVQEYSSTLAMAKKDTRRMRYKGMRFDGERFATWISDIQPVLLDRGQSEEEIEKAKEEFVFVKGPRARELTRQRVARVRREGQGKRRVGEIRLRPGKNMVVPKDVLAGA